MYLIKVYYYLGEGKKGENRVGVIFFMISSCWV